MQTRRCFSPVLESSTQFLQGLLPSSPSLPVLQVVLLEAANRGDSRPHCHRLCRGGSRTPSGYIANAAHAPRLETSPSQLQLLTAALPNQRLLHGILASIRHSQQKRLLTCQVGDEVARVSHGKSHANCSTHSLHGWRSAAPVGTRQHLWGQSKALRGSQCAACWQRPHRSAASACNEHAKELLCTLWPPGPGHSNFAVIAPGCGPDVTIAALGCLVKSSVEAEPPLQLPPKKACKVLLCY